MTDPDDLHRRVTLWLVKGEGSTEVRALVRDLWSAVESSVAELATAQRERDSLARRCAVRYEESEKLRERAEAAEGELAAARTRRDWFRERSAAARTILTQFVEEAPYAAQMYDDPRCCYCRVIIGVEHTDGCLVSRACAWLAGTTEPADPEVSR